jgi:hypothetical protein
VRSSAPVCPAATSPLRIVQRVLGAALGPDANNTTATAAITAATAPVSNRHLRRWPARR